MVIKDFHSEAGAVMRVFREYAFVSGLRLGMPKTIIVHLWKHSMESFVGFPWDSHPEWRDAQVQSWGSYLGFTIGPGKAYKMIGQWHTQSSMDELHSGHHYRGGCSGFARIAVVSCCLF